MCWSFRPARTGVGRSVFTFTSGLAIAGHSRILPTRGSAITGLVWQTPYPTNDEPMAKLLAKAFTTVNRVGLSFMTELLPPGIDDGVVAHISSDDDGIVPSNDNRVVTQALTVELLPQMWTI